jgi:hypothetical protein
VPSEHGHVPAGFDAWFARACARNPEQRFQSAAEAAAELSRLCLSKGDGALVGDDIAAVVGKRRRRSGTTFAKYSVVLFSMALASGAVGFTLFEGAHSVEATTAPLPAEQMTPLPAEQMTAAASKAEPTPVLPSAAPSLPLAAVAGAIDPSESTQPSSLAQSSSQPPSSLAEPSPQPPSSPAEPSPQPPSSLVQPSPQPPRADSEVSKPAPPARVRQLPRPRRPVRTAPEINELADPVDPNEMDFGI